MVTYVIWMEIKASTEAVLLEKQFRYGNLSAYVYLSNTLRRHYRLISL